MALTGSVHVEIDELDLSAVPAARRFLVAASFERELARLIELGGLPTITDERERQVTGPGIALDANPVLVGQALARSVYGALA
jgi:hypothetical protein